MNCPKCHSELAFADINIQKDIAHCSQCNHVFTISEEVREAEHKVIPVDFDIESPPNGASFERRGDHIIYGAHTRSKIAIFLIPFMLIWSGGSIGMIYVRQIITGEYSIFLSIFGLPFLAGTIFFLWIIMQSLAGKVIVTLDNKGGEIFSGVGKLGIKKEFLWEDVVQVIDKPSTTKTMRNGNRIISIEGAKRINFGNALSDERRDYILFTTKHFLEQIKRKGYIL